MNKILSRSAVALLLCAILFTGSSCSLFKKTSRARVKYLMVTGNYMKPRLLAELAQYRSKQPILLFQQDSEGDRLFYLSANNKSEEIAPEKFMEFVQYLNPRTLVVIGDENCVPTEYVAQARDEFRVMTIDSANWELNAQMLGELLGQPRLNREFKDFVQRYEENVLPSAAN